MTSPSTSDTSPKTWHRDILGDAWQAQDLDLGHDDEGPVTATLVRRSSGPQHGRAVLYIHGFVDYFFQEHQAEAFENLGFDFYAIDLRKYGRSLREGQTPNYVTELAQHRTELEMAKTIIRDVDNHDELIVLGHSTGGLIAALWANATTGIDGLILNSPWFDLNKPWFLRTIGTTLVSALGKIAPHLPVGSLAPHYGAALHIDTGGQWTYDLDLKPHEGFPVRAGWFSAIRRGHAAIRHGLTLPMPVLVLCSTRSGDATRFHNELLTTDSVLNIDHIVTGAQRLGEDVTIAQIEGGTHDLSLSGPTARAEYFHHIGAWLREKELAAPTGE
ncbi:alpha/beta hydrolase [Jonesia quinghaiensis]|uniref:alpha/beta hydrolase n=1 Tax=Jonesia quinghaiensis TaxID=262806 RepID=UPI000401D49C|nr:alpha/beta hydrolase [Jonesia quinghaiensis]